MKRRTLLKTLPAALLAGVPVAAAGRTDVSIDGDRFLINGRPTYEGRSWRGMRIEGLLMNSRMVQGIFDDLNPETRSPVGLPRHEDVGPGAQHARVPRRDARVAAPRASRASRSTSRAAARRATRRTSRGTTTRFNARRLAAPRLSAAGWSGSSTAPTSWAWSPILGYFYFGQDQRLENDAAVRRAVREATTWLLREGYRNVLVEIANECDNRKYEQPLIQAPRVHELIELAKSITRRRPAPSRERQLQRRIHPDAERRRRSPTSCCCTATASAIRIASRGWSRRPAK